MLKRTVLALICFATPAFAQNAAVEQVRTRTQSLSREDSDALKMIAEDRGEVVELTGKPARAAFPHRCLDRHRIPVECAAARERAAQ